MPHDHCLSVCSCLIEAIFVKLCTIQCNPRKRGTGTMSRWDLITEDYSKIKQCILASEAIMQQTNLLDYPLPLLMCVPGLHPHSQDQLSYANYLTAP